MVLVEGVMVLLLEEMRSGVVGSLTQLKSVCASSARGYISKYKLTIRGGSKTSLSLSLCAARSDVCAVGMPTKHASSGGRLCFLGVFFPVGSFPEVRFLRRQFPRKTVSQKCNFPISVKKDSSLAFLGSIFNETQFLQKIVTKKTQNSCNTGAPSLPSCSIHSPSMVNLTNPNLHKTE